MTSGYDYDFRGHTRGTLVVGIAYGCPYYKTLDIISLFYAYKQNKEKKQTDNKPNKYEYTVLS